MAVRLDYQPITRVENSSSGSMDKTNQSNFVTTDDIDMDQPEMSFLIAFMKKLTKKFGLYIRHC